MENKAWEFIKKEPEEIIKNKEKYLELLVKHNLDEKTISAALIYDSLEMEKIKENFCKETVMLAEGLNKFNFLAFKAGKRNKDDAIRKMLIATTEDLRILLIKLLERLYEMRNLVALESVERRRISKGTLDIYAPIAYRLGLSNIKWELEDSAFKHLYPDSYNEIKKKVGIKREKREEIIEELKTKLENEIKKKRVKAEVFGRPKHFYSIYKKIINKGKRFEEVFDLLGLRVIVGDSDECYKVLGVVNELWDVKPERLKDYIVSPKENNYQSIHLGLDYEKTPVEVQIRTKRMNDIAEEGIAAHWKYKGLKGDRKFNKQLSWLRQILDFGTETDREFLYQLKLDLFENNIFCFTPKGDIIELDEGSTLVDFAYGVHSEIGDKCVGGRVNGNFVKLKYKLKSGDEVEIMTSKLHTPSRDWLGFVKTNKALEKIRKYLSLKGAPGRKKADKEEKISENFIGVDGNYEIKIAKCCNPLPHENLIGVVGSVKNVIVHSQKCKNTEDVKRKTNAFWVENFNSLINIDILADDRLGFFAEVLNAIAAMRINIQSARAQNAGEEIAQCVLAINFFKLEDLKKVLERIGSIEGVRRVRVE